MTTEALERPRWVRFGERLFGRIIHPKTPMTFGITQVPSVTPLTDLESIQLTVMKLASRSDICTELTQRLESEKLLELSFNAGYPPTSPLNLVEDLIRIHNPNPTYVETASSFAISLHQRF